jgi:hypothetical protein
VVTIIGLLTGKGMASPPPLPTGPVTFKLSALEQLVDSVTLKTNKTTTSTNITTMTKSTASTKSVVNKDLLKLLANSFTNLPTTITNGQLVTDGEGSFLVVTSTATNNVSSVLSIEFNRRVISGSESVVMKSPPGTTTSETETATATQAARLSYDDSELTTRDGEHTTITLHGLMVTKYGDATTKFTTSFTLTGQGDGLVEDRFMVFTGTLTGSISGNVDLDDL